MKPTISIVISCYNDAKKLERTLALVDWADEIVVVDAQSTDNTREVAAKYTKKIHSRPNDLMLNKNKNFGFTKATGDWILNLDSDEVVTEELKNEILTTLSKFATDTTVNGFWIPRKNMIFGKWIRYGFWWPDKQLRLFRRGKGKFPLRYIHEYIKVEGGSRELTEPYIHYNYESVSQYITKLERCTTSEAAEYLADGYDFTWTDAIRFPVRDFVKVYFSQQGYKDGLHGLVLSMLQAFYACVVFAKLWETHGFKESDTGFAPVEREFIRAYGELRYWDLSVKIRESTNPIFRLMLRVKRRLYTPSTPPV